ncbi:MAG: hypothetical protein IKG69_05165 [Atopobiaceae bacterium]|nr:hypothetical protein [Atopobiaceae bacterium]
MRLRLDFAVAPSLAARTAASSASPRYSIGLFGDGGAFIAFAAWLSATRVASSDAQ